MTKFVSVGKILNFHGIKGEAKVGFTKNQEDFFCSLDEVFVKKEQDYVPLKITNSRLHKNFALVKFENINSIDELLPYKGAFLYVQEDTIRENLEEDEFLIDELVGMNVLANDKKVGVVVEEKTEDEVTEPAPEKPKRGRKPKKKEDE